MVFFESPVRLQSFLKDALKIFGNRKCCICRELTKIYEEKRRGTLEEAVEYFSEQKPKGEFIAVIAGNSEEITISDENPEEKMTDELKNLLKTQSVKEAVKKISEKYSVSKKIIYRRALELKEDFNDTVKDES